MCYLQAKLARAHRTLILALTRVGFQNSEGYSQNFQPHAQHTIGTLGSKSMTLEGQHNQPLFLLPPIYSPDPFRIHLHWPESREESRQFDLLHQ